MTEVFALLIPIVAIICVFTFVAVASWADARCKEREAFYRSEVLKKLVEAPGERSNEVMEMMREEERRIEHRRREGQKLGGLITTGVGIGMMVFLATVAPTERAWTVGLIPLLVGVALLVYVRFLAVNPEAPGAAKPAPPA